MTTPTRVLVVDDEDALASLVRRYLEREGFDVTVVHDGAAAIAAAEATRPDLIVLDLMLPSIDGLEVARQVRVFSDAYIIMVTAKGEESDRVVGLSTGADDYLVKPFSPAELVARVRAMLRRPRTDQTVSLGTRTHGELVVDPGRRTVMVGDREVDLTRTEFDILDTLTSAPHLVFTKEVLLDRVWGSAEFHDAHLLATHVGNLRSKLGDDAAEPRHIETVRGVGYRMLRL